jgi:hypothetical protein
MLPVKYHAGYKHTIKDEERRGELPSIEVPNNNQENCRHKNCQDAGNKSKQKSENDAMRRIWP